MKKILFLLLTAVCAMLYAPPAQAWTVYLDPANTSGFTPTAYVWGGSGDLNGGFPGKSMTKDEYGRWKASGTGTPTNVIFTKGDNSNTKLFNGDPVFNDGYTYTWNGTAGSTPTSSKWNEYTFYFDNSAVSVTDLPFNGWNSPKVYYNENHNNMTLKDGNIYTYSISATSAPKVQFTDGSFNSYQNNGHNTTEVTVTDGYIYKINGKDGSWVYTVDGSVYNPVSVTSVELLKDGTAVGSAVSSAPYSFSLSDLTGDEKFLVRVNYDNSTSKTYTVSSGTNLTETTSTTGFSIGKKYSAATLTVSLSGLEATSYALSNTTERPIELTRYTIYLDKTKVTSDGLSTTNQVYFHTWDGANYDPACDWDNPIPCEKVNDDSNLWKVTFACTGTPKGFFLSSIGNENYTDRTVDITPTDGYVYTANGERDNFRWKVDAKEYDPTTVTKVTLWKDGSVYAEDTEAPFRFDLKNLTGTGVYRIVVDYSNGTSKSYIREFPNDPKEWLAPSTNYTLIEANETLRFRLNSTDSEHIISNARMTVNFSGVNATTYTLSEVTLLSHTAQMWLYDGTTEWPMEHRRDGKYVLADFTPDAAKTYTVLLSLDGTTKTSYTVSDTSTPLVGGIRDAVEGTTGFSIDPTLTDVNVSVRLVKGVPTKISLGDRNGFYTIYLKQRFTDWAPYARLSSTDNDGFWWTVMAPVNGVRGVYSVTFDPTLYNRVRFLRQDHFDGNTNHQTVRTEEVINGHIYTINDEIDHAEGRGLDHELFVMPVTLASVSLVSADGTETIPLSLDDSGNWKATVTNTMTGTYLIKVTGTDPTGAEQSTMYTITDSELSATTSNGTADEVVAGETPFTLNFGSATNAILSLEMNADGSAPVKAYLTDPNGVISALYLICRDTAEGLDMTNPDARFTTSDGGHTWLWRGKVTPGKKYYIRGTAPNGVTHIHSIGTNASYGLKAEENNVVIKYGYNPTWNGATWSEQSEWDGNEYSFSFASDPTEIKMVIETRENQTKLGQMYYAYEKYTPRASAVYMPLSRDDFSMGPRYFLVGNRTAEWRLQPEWELAVDETGSSASGLTGRLMYKQYFGIAKVNTYDDYIMHHYELYTTARGEVTESNRSLTLALKGETSATRYDDPSSYKNGSDYAFWNTSSEDWVKCTPALITDATVTLNSEGIPTNVTFEFTTDKAEVAKNRAFTLVGANIQYEGVYTFNSGRQRNLNTMTHVRSNNTVDGWQNSWIQANAGGVPYVDGMGNVLYNTAFDATWMKSHSTPFYKQAKDFTYDSKSVTFLPCEQLDKLNEDEYADLYKFHPASAGGTDKIGDNSSITVGEITYGEEMVDYSGLNRTSINHSGWQCMVVKDMWLEGPFKIWAGWGGNLKRGDDVKDWEKENEKEDVENAARWFYENGGHGFEKQEKEVAGSAALDSEKAKVYATRRDVNAADFKVPALRYYPRVILWYNPDEGFDASAIQLVRPGVGPNIQAFYNTRKKNTLRYNWWVSVKEGDSHDEDLITGYVIDRYKSGADGSETLDRANIENVTFSTAKKVKDLKITDQEIDKGLNFTTDARVFHFTDDSEMLEAGSKYRYRIRLTVNGAEKKAASNELPIYTLEAPVIVTVKQQKFAADGSQDDNGDLYSFNIQLDAKLAAKHADKIVNPTAPAADQVTVATAVNKYVVSVDQHVYDRLIKATSLTVGDAQAASTNPFSLSTGSDVLIGQDTYLPAGRHYFTVLKADMVNQRDLPTYVWHNVAPNRNGFYEPLNDAEGKAIEADAYRFYVDLVSEERFLPEWGTLNFAEAPGSADVIAPPTKLTVGTPIIRKAEGVTMSNTPVNKMVSGTRLADYSTSEADGSHSHIAVNPVHFTRLNEVVADATFDALPVTDEVIQNHTIGYTVYVTKTGTTLAQAMADKKGARTLEAPAANKVTEAEISNFDLDDSDTRMAESIDGHGDKYIDASTDGNYDTHLRVAYTPNWEGAPTATYHNDHDDAEKGLVTRFAVDVPTVSVKTYDGSTEVKARRYESKYYHNGGKKHLDPDHGPKDPCDCGDCTDDTKPHTESLGWFAHGVVDLNLSDIDNETRNAYVGFHLQQTAVNDANGGCYSLPGDKKLYRHSFAGTRSSNGGAPVHSNWGAEWGVTTLAGYTEWKAGTEWTAANDWSTKAVEQGHLPLHINPLCKLADENGELKGNLKGYVDVIYPVVKTDGVTLRLKNSPAAAPRRADGETPTEAGDIYLVGAKAPVEVNILRSDIVTGVEDVAVDNNDAPVEYYNLQGFRVMNPAKGQIYIVRQGNKVSKVLLK